LDGQAILGNFNKSKICAKYRFDEIYNDILCGMMKLQGGVKNKEVQ